MHGLPVSLVQRDMGGALGAKKVDLGASLEEALLGSPEVTKKLSIHVESMAAAEDRMDRGSSYVTLVVPPDFTAAALNLVGAGSGAPARAGLPTVQLLSNQRAGTEGASLATAVLNPALAAISRKVGATLLAEGGSRAGPAARADQPFGTSSWCGAESPPPRMEEGTLSVTTSRPFAVAADEAAAGMAVAAMVEPVESRSAMAIKTTVAMPAERRRLTSRSVACRTPGSRSQ